MAHVIGMIGLAGIDQPGGAIASKPAMAFGKEAGHGEFEELVKRCGKRYQEYPP